MKDLGRSFWLGIGVAALVGIPFSIFANMMTPKWQAWRGRRSELQAQRQTERDAAFREQAQWFADNPVPYLIYVQRTSTQATVKFLTGFCLMTLGGISMVTSMVTGRTLVALFASGFAFTTIVGGYASIDASGRTRRRMSMWAVTVARLSEWPYRETHLEILPLTPREPVAAEEPGEAGTPTEVMLVPRQGE